MENDAVDGFVLDSQVNLFGSFKTTIYQIDDMVIDSILRSMSFENNLSVSQTQRVVTFEGKIHFGSRSIPFSDVDVF